jgi:hypothetical protein
MTSTASVARSDRSCASSPEPIKVDQTPANDTQEGNSPTPKADTQLQPALPETKGDDLLTNMMQIMNQCMNQHLAPITSHLATLEEARTLPTWNHNSQEEIFGDYSTGNVDIDRGYANYTTTEQQTLLNQQNEMAQYYMQLDEEEQCCIDDEEARQVTWKNAFEQERAHLTEEVGGNPGFPEGSLQSLGEEANPIYIPDSQELTVGTIVIDRNTGADA